MKTIFYLVIFLPVLVFAGWRTTELTEFDEGGCVETSIVTDSNNYFHIAYVDQSGSTYRLRHGYWNGQRFNAETVYSNSYQMDDCQIAIDSNDNLGFICVLRGTSTDYLMYVYYNGSSWAYTQVDSADTFPSNNDPQTSLTFIGSYPHISYAKWPESSPYDWELCHAWKDGSGWNDEVVLTGGQGMYNTIISDNGNPQIAFLKAGDTEYGDLGYAWKVNGSWNISTIEADSDPWCMDMAFNDASDTSHISYYSDTENRLKYAAGDESTWSMCYVDDDTGETGRYNSIALDSSDVAHIAYRRGIGDWPYFTSSQLKYATYNESSWTPGTWDITIVDTEYPNTTKDGYTGQKGVSLAIASDDTPFISYIVYSQPYYDYLKLAWYVSEKDEQRFAQQPKGMESIAINKVAPNPASSNLSFKIDHCGTGAVQVDLFDLSGKTVKHLTLSPNNSIVDSSIDVQDLSKGIYILKATSSSSWTSKRVIVNR